MSKILDDINQANLQAMRDKNQTARTIYSILKNKALLISINKREKGEQLSDTDLISMLQKTVKELIDEAENFQKAGKDAEVKNILEQKKLVEAFLPKMLSEAEVLAIIHSLSDKSVPAVMKHFKAEYAGKVDMRVVQDVLKNYK